MLGLVMMVEKGSADMEMWKRGHHFEMTVIFQVTCRAEDRISSMTLRIILIYSDSF